MTVAPHTCPACGGALAAGRCLRCENQSIYRYIHREIVILAVLIVVTVALFAGTRRLAASNDTMRRQDARAWYESGLTALRDGHLDTAVADLRRAATKNSDTPAYRLALARALMTGRQDDAARQVLLELREREPDDADDHPRGLTVGRCAREHQQGTADPPCLLAFLERRGRKRREKTGLPQRRKAAKEEEGRPRDLFFLASLQLGGRSGSDLRPRQPMPRIEEALRVGPHAGSALKGGPGPPHWEQDRRTSARERTEPDDQGEAARRQVDQRRFGRTK